MSLVVALALVVAPLADPAKEARAQSLEREIRCVQCQNEPIAQSNADIAEDMRALVRERVAAGDSDAQIRAFFRERYGDFVLLRPAMEGRTVLLWVAPLVLMAAAGAGFAAIARRRAAPGESFPPEESER